MSNFLKLTGINFALLSIVACGGSGNSLSTPNASDCFNSAIYEKGAVLETQATVLNANKFDNTREVSKQYQKRSIKGVEQFNNQALLAMLTETTIQSSTAPSDNPYTTIQNTYIKVDVNKKRVETYGYGSKDYTLRILTPASLQRFDLNINEKYQNDYTADETITIANSSISTVNYKLAYSFTTEFVGFEDITINGAKLKTCKFKIIGTLDDLNPQPGDERRSQSTYDSWYYRGVEIKRYTEHVSWNPKTETKPSEIGSTITFTLDSAKLNGKNLLVN